MLARRLENLAGASQGRSHALHIIRSHFSFCPVTPSRVFVTLQYFINYDKSQSLDADSSAGWKEMYKSGMTCTDRARTPGASCSEFQDFAVLSPVAPFSNLYALSDRLSTSVLRPSRRVVPYSS